MDYEMRMARRLVIADVMKNWGFNSAHVIIQVVRLIEWGRHGRVINLYK